MNPTDRPINTLMIVDDNDVDQLVYQRIVEQSGLVRNTVCFHYGSDALDHFREHGGQGIDAVLLDINMPRMNGFEFLDEATRLFGDDFTVVIVMLTSSMNPKDAERARSYPIVRDYIGKPLTAEHLKRIVELIRTL